MSSLALLRQKRMKFAGEHSESQIYDEKERVRRRAECKRIYMEALERIGRQAEYVDRLNATRLDPISLVFGEEFHAQQQAMTSALEAEWLSDEPDLTRFAELVTAWEQRCVQELESWLRAVKTILKTE